jgi:hypothetical protein
VVHSSIPLEAVCAAKTTLLGPRGWNDDGEELADPGTISFSRVVVFVARSVTNTSTPIDASLSEAKISLLLDVITAPGNPVSDVTLLFGLRGPSGVGGSNASAGCINTRSVSCAETSHVIFARDARRKLFFRLIVCPSFR